MSSLLPLPDDLGQFGSIVSDVKRLEEEWQSRGDVALEEFWRQCRDAVKDKRSDPLVHLGALIKADMRCRFERGRPAEVTNYLDRFPGLDAANSRVISLIYEEYCLREESGEEPDVEGFCLRYPRWRDSFVSQLRYHHLFSQAGVLTSAEPNFPKPGEDFEEFRLEGLIGKGGSSRVYLARDLSLGGKRVVLKVSADNGEEPRTQGVLDHPNIVPVNSVAFRSSDNLRGLSMPYRPGLPLDEIIRRLRAGRRPTRASIFWETLLEGMHPAIPAISDKEKEGLRREGPVNDSWRAFPRSGSFAEGAAWLAMTLARALHYAHEMKTFHRDVKPGNILLTIQHGPQLLDFNLAASPYVADRANCATLGGTLPYMAPEQIRAFLDPQAWDLVGARSDLYSLGLVLREVLTGLAPELPNERVPLPRAMQELLDRRYCLDPDVRASNPDVPHALQAIVSKCLGFDPEDRYPDAHTLAVDLDAFLHRQPLRVASNPSRLERTRNWIYRNRGRITINAAYLTLLGGIGIVAASSFLKPEASKLPEFLKAVEDIREGRADAAMQPLRRLVEEYPRSPLPRAYLGLAQALSLRLSENEAQLSLREFFELPDAEKILLDWSREDPTLHVRLYEFAREQIEQLNRFAVRHYAGKSADEVAALVAANREIERRYYEVMLRALRIGLAVEPKSDRIPELMAAAEEFLGEYETAYNRVDRLIEAVRPHVADRGRDRLIALITQRGRVAVRWASLLREKGDPPSIARGIDLLSRSIKDMDTCSGSIFKARTTDEDRGARVVMVYNHLWVMTESWLALADIQRAGGFAAESSASIQKARASSNRLVDYVNGRALKVTPELGALVERVRKGVVENHR